MSGKRFIILIILQSSSTIVRTTPHYTSNGVEPSTLVRIVPKNIAGGASLSRLRASKPWYAYRSARVPPDRAGPASIRTQQR